MASSSLDGRLAELETRARTLLAQTMDMQNGSDDRSIRIDELIKKESENTHRLFRSLYHPGIPSTRLTGVASSEIAFFHAFKYATPQESSTIACVCRKWNYLSSEVSVQQSIWITYAKNHLPDIYDSYDKDPIGKALMIFQVKNHLKKKSIKSQIDDISRDIVSAKKSVSRLQGALAVHALIVGGVCLSFIPAGTFGPGDMV